MHNRKNWQDKNVLEREDDLRKMVYIFMEVASNFLDKSDIEALTDILTLVNDARQE